MQPRKTTFNASWAHLLKVVPSGVLLPVSAGVKLRRGAMNKEATSLQGKELVCAHPQEQSKTENMVGIA